MKRVPKRFAYGEITDTNKRFKEEHDSLIQKWKDDLNLKLGDIPQPNQSKDSIECGCGSHYTKDNRHHHIKTKKHLEFISAAKTDIETSIFHKKNRRVHINGFSLDDVEIIITPGTKCIYETCVRCGTEFPLTPLYFPIEKAGSKKTNVERESGKEIVSNSPHSGCRECQKKVSMERSQTQDEYIRILLKSYPKLTKEWFISQPKKCCISDIPLFQGQKENSSWTISVQNNKPFEEHTPENCCLIAREFNVQQQKAIPDLLKAWKEAFKSMANEIMNPSSTVELVSNFKIWYNNEPRQNGVTVPNQITNSHGKKITNPEYSKQCQTFHLKKILRTMINNYKHQDKVSKRNPTTEPFDLTVENIYQKMIDQKCKCHYTGILFSFNRDTWNYFSIERLDNSKNHTVDNCVFICRLFNTAGQLNKMKILTALLSQQHVALSNEQKYKIQEKLSVELAN
jgi:hypothetical protein